MLRKSIAPSYSGSSSPKNIHHWTLHKIKQDLCLRRRTHYRYLVGMFTCTPQREWSTRNTLCLLPLMKKTDIICLPAVLRDRCSDYVTVVHDSLTWSPPHSLFQSSNFFYGTWSFRSWLCFCLQARKASALMDPLGQVQWLRIPLSKGSTTLGAFLPWS